MVEVASSAEGAVTHVRRRARRLLRVTTEPVRWSACYAPHSSMYFDQHGKVRACCQNTGTYLGDVTRQSLREIWESVEAERMRTALEGNDYSEGCEFCAWQVREGNEDILFAKGFDELEPPSSRPRWPRQMEFSLTNTCNLQCVMCNGDWSSSIRSQRERRAPLPKVYDEQFFAQLAEFLPHLDQAKFLGGEPFLGTEPIRVLEMLAELDRPPNVCITTNATTYGPRVERILTTLRPAIIVSLDGASPSTYDAIRVGASFDAVMANVDRFRDELGSDRLTLTTCLMRSNWHEFADILALAEERDLHAYVNVVRFPADHSLYQLDVAALAPIVDALHRTKVALTGQRRSMWEGHVAALAHRLDVLRDDADIGPAHGLPGAPGHSLGSAPASGVPGDPGPTSRWTWLPFHEHGGPGGPPPEVAPATPTALVHLDTEGVVTVERSDQVARVVVTDLHGHHISDLIDRLESLYGPNRDWPFERRTEDGEDVFHLWPSDPGMRREIEIVGIADRDDEGRLVGSWMRITPAG